MQRSIKNILFSSAIGGIHSEMDLHPITLKFPNKLEKEFRKYHFKYSVDFVRVALLFSMVFYLIFNILDYVVFPEKQLLFLFIRVIIIIPSAVIIYGLSKESVLKRNWQAVLVFMVLTAGVGIIIMILFSNEMHQHGYYVGLILVLIFNYVFARLRFVNATITGWILFALYFFAEMVFFDLPPQILFMYTFFLGSANIFGLAGSYFIEYQMRREFFIIQLLEKEKNNVESLNKNLEKKVIERTNELGKINSELSKHKTELEKTVTDRTKELQEKVNELESYNQLFVGREFRIKELKDQIAELKNELKNK